MGQSDGKLGCCATVPYYSLYPNTRCRGGCRTRLDLLAGTAARWSRRYRRMHHHHGLP